MNDRDMFYKKLKATVFKCTYSKKISDRIKYAKQLIECVDQSQKNNEELKGTLDDWMNKLITAAKTIQDQNEWIECLYIAAGQDKDEMIKTALKERKAIEYYKKKTRKEE